MSIVVPISSWILLAAGLLIAWSDCKQNEVPGYVVVMVAGLLFGSSANPLPIPASLAGAVCAVLVASMITIRADQKAKKNMLQ